MTVAGLRFDSLADMPEGMRKLAADKIVSGKVMGGPDKTLPVAGSKYHNIKTETAGIRFDSKKEARRYEQLLLAQSLGVIEDLRLQVDFTLQEAYTTAEGQRIRAIRYKADFTYKVKSAGYDHVLQLGADDIEYLRSLWPGALVIEDTKSQGTRTKEYQIKRKLMADKGYIIREV